MAKVAVVFLSVFMSVSAFAQAKPVSIFGLELGQKIKIEQCRSRGKFILPPVSGSCIQESGVGVKADMATVANVFYAYGDLPAWVNGTSIKVVLEDQKMIMVIVPTSGILFKTLALENLTAKFGAASSVEPRQIINPAGASVNADVHKWVGDDLQVVWLSVLQKTTEGSLQIYNSAGKIYIDKDNADLRKFADGKVPL
jgi:hypothetical protein